MTEELQQTDIVTTTTSNVDSSGQSKNDNVEQPASKETKKSSFKTYVVWGIRLVVLVGAGWFISAALEEFSEQGGEEGIFICNDHECFKTAHIHSDITFDLCGEQPVLPRETGPLDGLHTHKEKNYLHFHDKLDLDPEDHSQYFDERLSIFDIMEIFDLQAEKYCGTDDVVVEVYKDNELLEDWSEYNRNDGDDIRLVYRRQ